MTVRRHLVAVGDLIRSSRNSAGLTQRALGERAGIVGKYVSEIERGTRDVPLSTIVAIVERGLQMRLSIKFERVDGTVKPHAQLDELADSISELPEETRTKILELALALVELVK
jgi:transcriptional regulator with XRE-family HTH domain